MITIDVDSAEPLFSQLVNQIKIAIQQALVAPGDALPSIRQLATDLDINAKTVAKAYRILERDNVIETKGYRGTFVHSNAILNSQFDLEAWINEQLFDVISTFKDAGATDSEIRIAFNNIMSQQPKGK
ncbi:GntR family transcriptional regulator [Psychrosphaera aestuarii]|uniref:GntR family transcriptional regulator n=1 Tax=Psychrosphaera aestuarii TaxID=1266052 RepID=UPI001B319454|nr:GntR family transcriptional regulator [Psychrosphaera aestuarii]